MALTRLKQEKADAGVVTYSMARMRLALLLILAIGIACSEQSSATIGMDGGEGPRQDSGAAADARPPADATPALVTFVDGRPEEIVPLPHDGIDSFIRGVMDEEKLVGVAIGVVEAGEVTYLKGYGYADLEEEVPVLGSVTMFRWASISKTLTAVAAFAARAEGDLDLDVSIENYYAAYNVPTTYLVGGEEVALTAPQRLVTPRWLLAHMAGIMHYTNGLGSPEPPWQMRNDPITNTGLEWALAYFADKPLVNIPGDAVNYSTFGFNLMGVVLEYATGQSLAGYVDTHIATTAGLDTLQPDYEWVEIANRATGYRQIGTTNVPQSSGDVSWKLGGGGFISTARDLAHYCRALMGETLLDASEKSVAWSSQMSGVNYGLGFGIGSRAGHAFVEHSGTQPKVRSRLRLYRDDDICVVVMSNSQQADTLEIVQGVEDAVR